MVDPTTGEYDDMPHIAPGNIEPFTGRILDNVKTVKEEQLISGKFRFRPNDVVYGKINPQLGKYFYASIDGLTSADAYVFNGKNGITQKFLYSVLQTKDFFKYSISVSKRSGMPKINRDELNAYSFCVPKEEEQEKIGDFLLGIDNLITLHQRKLFLNFVKKNDWEQRKLGDTVQITMGQSPDGSTYSETPSDYILVQGNADLKDGWVSPRVWTSQMTKKADAGDLIMSVRAPAGAMGKTAYNAVIGRGVAAIKGNEFIYQSLVKMDSNGYWKKLSSGSTFESLNSNNIKDAEIFVPCDEEQQKIGQYFSNLDNLITLHQRKCDETKKLKKFMLQKMFPKKDANKPEIRFAGFTDDWEQRKLGEICQRVIRKNKNNESDLPLTIASQYGLIDQRDFFNKVVAAKDMSNYYLLRKGEFAYNKSYSNGFEYGSIKRLNAYEQGCLSTLYICFEITSDEVDSDYLECFFDTLKWYGDLSMICAEGARNHGLLNVDIKAFFADINVSTPTNLKEQRKIATYLNNLDHLITLHQRKCDELKEFKKYMLQNMFPQKG